MGSSGGEVSLLIRRVLHKLGVERDRVQFILTSASIPSDPEEQEKVKKFACDLSAQSFENNTFKLITGKTEPIVYTKNTFDPTIFTEFDIDELKKIGMTNAMLSVILRRFLIYRASAIFL